jgi:hypothetical protein
LRVDRCDWIIYLFTTINSSASILKMHFISLLVVFISTSSLHDGYKISPHSRTILKKEVKVLILSQSLIQI